MAYGEPYKPKGFAMYYRIITALVQLQLTARLLPNTNENRLIVLKEIRDAWSDYDGEWDDESVAFLLCANTMIEMTILDTQFAL